MAMATNGNEPVSTQGTNQKLAAALRDMQPATVAAKVDGPSTTYDLMTQARDFAASIRDLAGYSNSVADDIERTIAAYHGHMQRLLGKIGK
jgi:hypothetical protein